MNNKNLSMLRNSTITKSNKVVEAGYKLTLSEQRLLLMCISRIRVKEGGNIDSKFRISVPDFANTFDINIDNAYQELMKIAETLFERYIIINDPDNENIEKDTLKTRWISSIKYKNNQSYIDLTFAEDIKPYLVQLKREFTTYKLKYVINFTSIYAIRLYELLMQWISTGYRQLEIEWLKQQFQLADKYTRVSDLKTRVIIPAVEQINTFSDITITWNQEKKGHKITHFNFRFTYKTLDQIKELEDKIGNKIIDKEPNEKAIWEKIYQYIEDNDLEKELLKKAKLSNDVITIQAYEQEGIHSLILRGPIQNLLIEKGIDF